jgi:hypothetical protein
MVVPVAVTRLDLRTRVFRMIRSGPLLPAVGRWIGHVAGTLLTFTRRVC